MQGNWTQKSRVESIVVINKSLQCVDIFCCLHDMISAEGGVQTTSVEGVTGEWKEN